MKLKHSELKTNEKIFVFCIMALPLASFLIFYVYMNFNSFLLAFQEMNIRGETEFVWFANFEKLFSQVNGDSLIWRSLWNSIKMWWITFLITMPLYLIFSYYVFKKYSGGKLFSFMVLVPQVISSFLFALIYSKFVQGALPDIMAKWGFENFPNLVTNENTAFGNNVFFSIWLSFGTSVLVYTNAIRAIDDEIFESARLDGAGDMQEFFRIVLPLIWMTLTTMVVTGAVGMFTASGNLLVFYMDRAPRNIWGLGYYFTYMVKWSGASGGADITTYPMVATTGWVVTVITVPVVFLIKYIMDKCNRME